MQDNLKRLVRTLWDYHLLKQDIAESDLIFALGSIDILTAERAAELYLQGMAPKVLFSGGVAHSDDLLRTTWDEPEAVVFARRAEELGVPRQDMMLETEASNTGENILLGYEVLQRNNYLPASIILVQKPYMLRRTYATFAKQWPGSEVEFRVTCPQLSFEEYILDVSEQEQHKVINIMVGDLQRIKIYPSKGFQIPQEIPDGVWQAYEELVALGYDKHLIR